MKSVFKKIVSITMVSIVLFSTLSISVDMHYCGNHLVSMSFFGKAKGCGMEQGKSNDFDGCSVVKKNCCHNNHLLIKGQEDLKKSDVLQQPTVKQLQFAVAFVYTYTNLYQGVEKEKLSYKEYPPPLVVRDIYKLHEVYII